MLQLDLFSLGDHPQPVKMEQAQKSAVETSAREMIAAPVAQETKKTPFEQFSLFDDAPVPAAAAATAVPGNEPAPHAPTEATTPEPNPLPQAPATETAAPVAVTEPGAVNAQGITSIEEATEPAANTIAAATAAAPGETYNPAVPNNTVIFSDNNISVKIKWKRPAVPAPEAIEVPLAQEPAGETIIAEAITPAENTLPVAEAAIPVEETAINTAVYITPHVPAAPVAEEESLEAATTAATETNTFEPITEEAETPLAAEEAVPVVETTIAAAPEELTGESTIIPEPVESIAEAVTEAAIPETIEPDMQEEAIVASLPVTATAGETTAIAAAEPAPPELNQQPWQEDPEAPAETDDATNPVTQQWQWQPAQPAGVRPPAPAYNNPPSKSKRQSRKKTAPSETPSTAAMSDARPADNMLHPAETNKKRGRKSFREMDAEVDMVSVPDDDELYEKQYYPISTVASWFNVNTSLLRYWENEFDILRPRKNKKGDRLFRPEDIKNLQVIYHLLRQRKFTIEGAKEYLKSNKKKADTHTQLVYSLSRLRSFLLEMKSNLQQA